MNRFVALLWVVAVSACVGAPPVPCTECNGECVTLQSDAKNCGACGAVCGAGKVCSSGACTATCGAGQTTCSGACVDTRSSPSNCGACGIACATGSSCLDGACTLACLGPQTNCSGSCIDPQSSPAHCGMCGKACAASESCRGGSCVLSCVAPQSVCGGKCVDAQTDRDNCGQCGTICPGGKVCTAGSCATSCAAGLLTCGTGMTAFCANGQTDQLNCGACGKVCSALSRCVAGGCVVPVATPKTCAEVPQGADAGRTLPFFTPLFVDGRLDQPFNGLCGPDGGTYLPLARTMGNVNYGNVSGGGAYPPGDIVTRFTALRIDLLPIFDAGLQFFPDGGTNFFPDGGLTDGGSTFPTTDGGFKYIVIGDDYAYASTVGTIMTLGPNAPWASGGDCRGGPSQSGTGNADLRGTPFAVEPVWVTEGFVPNGTITYSAFRQVVQVSGGGFCGGTHPARERAPLRYCPSPRAETCDLVDNDCDGVIDNALPDAGGLADGGCP